MSFDAKGRPRSGETSDLVKLVWAVLMNGTQALAKKRDPGRRFWRYLLAALDPEYRRLIHRDRDPPFPLKAKVQPIRGLRGRRLDPELSTRDKALAWMVQRRIDRGERYKAAIYSTVTDIDEKRKEEGPRPERGPVTQRTVRNAYDRAQQKQQKR